MRIERPVIVYSAPGRPDCAALKEWLSRHGTAYEEGDLSAPAVIAEVKSRYGVCIAPITVVGHWDFAGTFGKLRLDLERLFSSAGEDCVTGV